MKSVFEPAVREEITERINSLTSSNTAQWGKMNVYQMVIHCARCDDMYHGDIKIKRVLIGRILGPTFLKKNLKDETPFGKGSPTSPKLISETERGDLELRKKEWIGRLEKYETYNNPGFVHPFFGPMTREQVGQMAYKHADHHLRQFGA